MNFGKEKHLLIENETVALFMRWGGRRVPKTPLHTKKFQSPPRKICGYVLENEAVA